MLEKEHLLDTIIGQVSNETNSTKIYLVTDLGTIVGLDYNFEEKMVIDVKITTYIKDMVSFKIRKIVA